MTVPTNVKYTYDLTVSVIEKLLAKYPFLSASSVGKSVRGKDIIALTCGRGRKKVFFNGSHHANEWITTPLLLKFVDKYLDAYKNKKEIHRLDTQRLFKTRTLVVVPLVNPDGVDLVNGAIAADDQYYKKALKISSGFPDVPFPDGWKANIDGIDLNLNYPANWNMAKENKRRIGVASCAPRDYVGEYPLCAPESRALYNLSVAMGFSLTLSYHTQGRVIYWKYLDYLPQNSEEIADTLSKASGYKTEVTPTESGFAGYKDWFISNYNLPGYTVEAGEGENPLPIRQFDEIYRDNEGLMAMAINMA